MFYKKIYRKEDPARGARRDFRVDDGTLMSPFRVRPARRPGRAPFPQNLVAGQGQSRSVFGLGAKFPASGKKLPAYPYCSAALCMVQSMNRRGFGGGGAMARNLVQFQKGLSEQEFDRLYGTEELCLAVVIGARWPDGFECPACGGRKHSVIKSRGLFQCSGCRRQTSPTAGTIFASTKLTLRQWFRAMYHMTQSKKGISSIELGRRLGVKQDTAWKVKHKLKQVMLERDAAKKLSGRIEIDDAYVGGERRGGKRGRGAAGKTPFVAAVETTEDGKPVRLKLRRVAGFSGAAIEDFAERSLAPDCAVVSDGLACFASVTKAGCTHTVIKTGSGAAGVRTPAFKWVNTALGNIKSAITGTYRSISSKHVPRYLAEYQYRFNRRYDLAAMIPRLTWAGVRTVPMPYTLRMVGKQYIFWAGNLGEAGEVWSAYQSAWLPASLLEADRRESLADALFAAAQHRGVSLHINKGLAGATAEAIASAKDTAMN